MLEQILEYERTLFLSLNGAHSHFADQFMWLYTSTTAWIPLYICFVSILFYANRTRWKEVLLIAAAIALTITLCDQFSAGFCKPFFARFRPTRHPDFMNDVTTVFNYLGGNYGFISSHAANGFGFAMVTSLIFKNKIYSSVIMLWATVTAYSRIYLGVHFISDIIPGILTGLLFGWMVFRLFVFAYKKIFLTHQKTVSYPKNGLPHIIMLLFVTVVIMAIIGLLYSCQLIPAFKI